MRTTIIIVSIVLVLTMIAGYNLFNKQHRSVENEEFIRVGSTQLLIKSFHFEKALMEEHFNENYLESDKLPKSTLPGKDRKSRVDRF